MTVGELGHRMSSSEFSEWMVFFREEPWGSEWENYLMAVPAQMFASAHSKKGQAPKFRDMFYKGPWQRDREKTSNAKRFLSFLDSKAQK